MDESIVKVIFQEEQYLSVFELSNFLYYIKTLYSWMIKKRKITDYILSNDQTGSVQDQVEVARTLVSEFQKFRTKLQRPMARAPYFKSYLKENDIYIAKIKKESPLEVWFVGVTTIVIAAFIFAGGEIDISLTPPRVKIKMGPLGDSIKKIKDAFKE